MIRLPTILVLLCACYTAASLWMRVGSPLFNKVLPGLPIVAGNFLGVLWLLRVGHVYVRRITKNVITVALLVLILGTLTIPVCWFATGIVYPIYILGDCAWVLWICLALIVFGSIRNEHDGYFEGIHRLHAILALVLFLDWIRVAMHHDFTLAPHFMLFSFVLSGAAVRLMSPKVRSGPVVLYMMLLLGFIAFAFWGHFRGLFLGYVFALTTWLLMMFHVRNLKVLGLLLAIILLTVRLFVSSFGDQLNQSRLYSSLATREASQGESVIRRVDEVRSAYNTLRETPGAVLVGFGHGAVFFPYVGSTRFSRNLTPEGYIHNIHVGPALLVFRYGVLGIGLYLVFWWVLLKGFLLGRWLSSTQRVSCGLTPRQGYFGLRVFHTHYFAFCILFLYSHFANHFVNPFFGVSFATTVMFISRPQLLQLWGDTLTVVREKPLEVSTERGQSF